MTYRKGAVFSVSLPPEITDFLVDYADEHQMKFSHVVAKALRDLKQREGVIDLGHARYLDSNGYARFEGEDLYVRIGALVTFKAPGGLTVTGSVRGYNANRHSNSDTIDLDVTLNNMVVH